MKPARVVLLDKPQMYRNRHEVRKDGKQTRFGIGVASRYSAGVMQEADLLELGEHLKKIATPDCYVFSWVTKPNVPFDVDCFRAWGLEYKTTPFVWVKRNKSADTPFCGPGAYNFSNVEEVWLGRYPGSSLWHPNNPEYKPRQPMWDDPGVSIECYEPHPRDENGKIIHSRKPESVQDMIDKWLRPYADGFSFVELFATRPKPGWICLGHELTGQDIREDLADMELAIEMSKV